MFTYPAAYYHVGLMFAVLHNACLFYCLTSTTNVCISISYFIIKALQVMTLLVDRTLQFALRHKTWQGYFHFLQL